MADLRRSKAWRQQLKALMDEQGVDLEYVAEYIGAAYNGSETVFYAKIPKKRKRFIGIGMALRQPVETINQWIMDYSSCHALYAKDVADDLIWIYLIRLSLSKRTDLKQTGPDRRGNINYFRMFEECQAAALTTYRQLWDEFTVGSLDTSAIEIELQKISYDDTFTGLRQFIIDHLDSFKTAYMKPRRMLDRYVECILNEDVDGRRYKTLNSLRGFLDDSMINYLSGNSDTVNTMLTMDQTDQGRPVRRIGFKQVPKNRKTHISLCLALGMTGEDINQYLALMGFAPLRDDGEEGKLAECLAEWEKAKPLQREYKNECFGECTAGKLSEEQMLCAIEEMLNLRNDLQSKYHMQGLYFPYS